MTNTHHKDFSLQTRDIGDNCNFIFLIIKIRWLFPAWICCILEWSHLKNKKTNVDIAHHPKWRKHVRELLKSLKEVYLQWIVSFRQKKQFSESKSSEAETIFKKQSGKVVRIYSRSKSRNIKLQFMQITDL